MSGQVPLADDAAAIAERLREIQAERTAAIAGCHRQPEAPSLIAATLEAMKRARARVYRGGWPFPADAPPAPADDLIERAIAEKLARHRVLS